MCQANLSNLTIYCKSFSCPDIISSVQRTLSVLSVKEELLVLLQWPRGEALGQVKKKDVSRPDFYKKRGGRAVFFIIYYFLLHAFFTHYYLPPGIRWSS